MTTHDGRPIIRMDQMVAGKRYCSTVVHGYYSLVDGKPFYTNIATGKHELATLPPKGKEDNWSYMVFEHKELS